MRRSITQIVFALVAATLVALLSDAPPRVQLGLALFIFIAWLWVSEALHVSITALLVPPGAVILGLVEVDGAFSRFSDPIIFLFMGGFALAAGLRKYELDRAFAVRLLRLSGGRPLLSILLLFIATSLLSMWISNTATVAMMMPLAVGLLAHRDYDRSPALFWFVLLGVAYAGNIGGMGTLIGSPPNAIAGSLAGISFAGWLGYGIPAVLLLLPVMTVVLFLVFRPGFGDVLELEAHATNDNQHARLVTGILLLTGLAWIFSSSLGGWLNITHGMDSVIAIAAAILLVATRCISTDELIKGINWSVLLLFGGGLTLSMVLFESGASAWLADSLIAHLSLPGPWLVLLLVGLFTVFMSELVSNTAAAALLMPIFLPVAQTVGIQPESMVILIALTASSACMLPVATPPNALAYSTGLVPQRQMIRAGLFLNTVFALILATFCYLLQTP